MASNTSSQSTIVPMAAIVDSLIEEEGNFYVPEPESSPEKLEAWKTQVIIPYSLAGKTYAFLGPFDEAHPRHASTYFPCPVDDDETILAFRPRYDMFFMHDPTRVFRTSPSIASPQYLAWLNRVQAAKGEHWKKLGIFDLIQLSRFPLNYDAAMLLSASFFWERSTNTFHLPCGMISPTLFDVAAIAGVRPTGITYDVSHARPSIKAEDLFRVRPTGNVVS